MGLLEALVSIMEGNSDSGGNEERMYICGSGRGAKLYLLAKLREKHLRPKLTVQGTENCMTRRLVIGRGQTVTTRTTPPTLDLSAPIP